MKNDIVLYKRIYQLFKNQIECGILPAGEKLPSRGELCKKLGVSEKTVRRVLDKLAEDGLIETQQRKRPIVKSVSADDGRYRAEDFSEGIAVPKDIFNTGQLLCYPVIKNGIALCAKEDWEIPAAIAARLDPTHGAEFWRLSHSFWRFFVARNCNDLILRAVDSLGFFNINPLPGSQELRERYLKSLRNFIQAACMDENSEKALSESLTSLYGSGEDVVLRVNRCGVEPDSPPGSGLYDLERRLRSTEERYSHVYMDILGLIAIGRYRPGDRLPTHKELQKAYDVSSDTTAKAIGVLQGWGVVTAKRGDGIYVSMDLAGLKNVKISPDMIGCHLRRFLDSLELLTITVDGVTEHAAAFITADEAGEFLKKMERLWNEEYLYQLTPMVLLEFITDHIQYYPLKEIYQVVTKNYHIGRCIPKLVTHGKTSKNIAIQQQAVKAVECLVRGDGGQFSKEASAMFRYVHELVVQECRRLGYWEIADRVYDGTVLWKKTYFLSRDNAWLQWEARQKAIDEESK